VSFVKVIRVATAKEYGTRAIMAFSVKMKSKVYKEVAQTNKRPKEVEINKSKKYPKCKIPPT